VSARTEGSEPEIDNELFERIVDVCESPTGRAQAVPGVGYVAKREGHEDASCAAGMKGGAMGIQSPSPKSEGRRLGGGAIASLTGVGLLIIFMIQNTESVQLDFLVWSFTWPLWFLTLASAVLGAVVWFGLGVLRRHRRRKDRRQDRRD
jgi:uncharacterized integral membrane protein